MKITKQLNEEIGLKDIKSRDALPCHLKGEYYVNGVFLDEYYFGEGEDNRYYDGDVADDIARYGCINRIFKRYIDDEHINKAMKEYNITREEYDLIADRLEDVLHVGMCGWCI